MEFTYIAFILVCFLVGWFIGDIISWGIIAGLVLDKRDKNASSISAGLSNMVRDESVK